MLRLGLLIGFYSYSILLLGLLGYLTRFPLSILFILFIFLITHLILVKRKDLRIKVSLSSFEQLLLMLLIFLIAVNLIGVLGPELAFDANWYHLTIPKLYIQHGSLFFMPASLFYYSLFPKLTEMLYVVPLFFWDERGAKLIHFCFGILTSFVIYKISRLYLTRKYSLLAFIIFYSNPVVGWLSITAYVDLARAFYESMALYYFLLWTKERKSKNLIQSAFMMGFAICVKILSLGTVSIFLALAFFAQGPNIRNKIGNGLLFLVLALLLPLPWFTIAFFYTGNPIYPIFSVHAPQVLYLHNFLPFEIFKNFINAFLFAADPILPFYLMIIPLLFFTVIKNVQYRTLLVYALLSLIIWYIASFSGLWHGTGQSGSSRFLIAYLPAYSVISAIVISRIKVKMIKNALIITVLILCSLTLIYRLTANLKYIPVIIGYQTKQEFLLKNLNFSFGDFYDEDKIIRKIVGQNSVLLLGMHNLYYADFPYTLSEKDPAWRGEYILVQNGKLPDKFQNAQVIYKNTTTNVTLYKL